MATNQLYVGDLPEQVDETFLKSLFSEFNITEIIIKKKGQVKKSFAFITFATHEEAEKALNELNYTKLDGVPIRISWSDGATKRIVSSNPGNLFIRGLDQSIEVSQLHEAFANFGEIISCKISMDEQGKSKGFGYIQFKNKEDAERAMSDLADASINGKKIEIQLYQKQRKSIEEVFTNVYIKPLSPDHFKTKEDLISFFSQYGDVTSAVLNTRIPESYTGFCNMKYHDDAVRAIQELNEKELDGKILYVGRAMTKAEHKAFKQKELMEFRKIRNAQTKGRNLYVKEFPTDVSDEEFLQYFQQFGEVESCKVARELETGESKGYGFVLYKDADSVQKCYKECFFHPLRGKTPFVALFKSKEVRNHEKKNQKASFQAQQQTAQYPQAQPYNQSPMTMGMTPSQMPVRPQGPLDQLSEKLRANGVTGQKLKQALQISPEQAAIILANEEKFTTYLTQFK